MFYFQMRDLKLLTLLTLLNQGISFEDEGHCFINNQVQSFYPPAYRTLQRYENNPLTFCNCNVFVDFVGILCDLPQTRVVVYCSPSSKSSTTMFTDCIQVWTLNHLNKFHCSCFSSSLLILSLIFQPTLTAFSASAKASPKPDASTTVFHRWDSWFRLKHFACRPKETKMTVSSDHSTLLSHACWVLHISCKKQGFKRLISSVNFGPLQLLQSYHQLISYFMFKALLERPFSFDRELCLCRCAAALYQGSATRTNLKTILAFSPA